MIMAYKTDIQHTTVRLIAYGLHDAGQAFANLALQATALGFMLTGWAASIRSERARSLTCRKGMISPQPSRSDTSGSRRQLPEQYRASETAPRTRKPLADWSFGAAWEQPFKL